MDGGDGSGGGDYGDLQQPAGGYGDVQDPPSPYDKNPKKPVTPPKPTVAPVKEDPMEQVKSDLELHNVNLEGANLINMQSHRNYNDFVSDPVNFGAWTNSSTDIYIDVWPLGEAKKAVETKKDPNAYNNMRAQLLVAVRHEIFHVVQFKGNGKDNGGRPKDFKQMIFFESTAYPDTKTWMADSNNRTYLTTSIGATKQTLDEISAGFKEEGDKLKKRMEKPDKTDDKTWLIKNKFLPATLQGNDYTIDDLYRAQ